MTTIVSHLARCTKLCPNFIEPLTKCYCYAGPSLQNINKMMCRTNDENMREFMRDLQNKKIAEQEEWHKECPNKEHYEDAKNYWKMNLKQLSDFNDKEIGELEKDCDAMHEMYKTYE